MFTKISTRIISALAGLAISASLVACGGVVPGGHRGGGAVAAAPTVAADVASVLAANADVHSTSLDYDADAAQTIELGGAGTEISAPGVYRLTGTVSDGQIIVNSPDPGAVYLILDGVNVASSSSAALNIVSAGEVVVVLADGSANTLSDAPGYATGEDGPSGALYSSADLTITGTGSLTVNGNDSDGIVAKDGLVIDSGTIAVNAADDAIRGKDYLAINGGTITVTAGGDGLKSDNAEDAAKGFVAIKGGAVTVTAGDDGVHGQTDTIVGGGDVTVSAGGDGLTSNTVLVVGGGTTTVTASTEGLESTEVAITGGTLDLTSSDDAINASASDSSTAMPSLVISGGTVNLDAEGDGIDVNGTFTMSGGTVTVHGPTHDGNGAMDVDSGFVVNGGTLLAGGAAGMAITPDSSSGQGWIAIQASYSAGQTIEVRDSSGTVLATYRAKKNSASLVVSAEGLVNGSSYAVYVDGNNPINVIAGQAPWGGRGGPRG
ncbi:MAG: carbohydrate-binding domain-containing protein [Propionibacteriaceae bacterium]|nr:carbohydrate-binding domain-containing protein [Propionibacteriaceae bacterium]